MKKSPEEMQTQYRDGCTHHRNGGLVFSADGSVVFNGKTDSHKGCNAAKRYVRSNGLKSFTVRD